MELTIELVCKKCRLLKRANCQDFVTLAELSRELKVTKTELMEFIENNEKLFNTSEQSISAGLRILEVYSKVSDNPANQEWLDNMKELYNHHVEVSKIDDYGNILGYQIIEDVEKGSKNREHLWRNTKAKLDYLHQLHIISSLPVYVGGYAGYNISIPHMFVNSDWQDELKKLGWTFNIR